MAAGAQGGMMGQLSGAQVCGCVVGGCVHTEAEGCGLT